MCVCVYIYTHNIYYVCVCVYIYICVYTHTYSGVCYNERGGILSVDVAGACAERVGPFNVRYIVYALY